ncbi:MAG: helicase, partial [Candidatus Bathyarchaeia archaeon]
MLEEKKERKAFRRVTEYKAIQAFIREGRGGLERLVERILAARREIEKELRSKSVLYMPKTREEAERAPGALGFSSPSKLIESFKSLVKNAAPILGITVDEGGEGVLKAAKGFEMPKALTTLDDFFGILYAKGRMATVISYGEHEDTLLLVNLKALYDSTTLYSEPIGVYLMSGRVIRGADLLTEVSTALSRCIGAAEGGNPGLPLNLKALIASRIRGSLSSVLSPLTNYRDGL